MAEPNKTAIDLHRTVLMKAVKKMTSSPYDGVKFLTCHNFFQTNSICEDHFRSREVVDPRNLK